MSWLLLILRECEIYHKWGCFIVNVCKIFELHVKISIVWCCWELKIQLKQKERIFLHQRFSIMFLWIQNVLCMLKQNTIDMVYDIDIDEFEVDPLGWSSICLVNSPWLWYMQMKIWLQSLRLATKQFSLVFMIALLLQNFRVIAYFRLCYIILIEIVTMCLKIFWGKLLIYGKKAYAWCWRDKL